MDELANQAEKGVGQWMFEKREFIALPVVLMLWFFEKPTVLTATLGMLVVGIGEMLRLYTLAFVCGDASAKEGDEVASIATDNNGAGIRILNVGPFRWVRNPLYLGNFLLLAGLVVFSGSSWFAIFGIGLFAVHYYFVTMFEGRMLEERWGEEYANYVLAVPGWIPRKIPGPSDYDAPQALSAALRVERRNLFILLAVVIVAALLA